MIKVTLGDNTKPVDVKPFPKLMIGNDDWIVEVYKNPETGEYIAIHRNGKYKGEVSLKFHIDGFIDFNDPITIQNA